MDKVTGTKWVDLWMDQTSYEADEYPFDMPAVFIEFNTENITTVGKRVQDMNCMVTFYVAQDCLADSQHGSPNQPSALAFTEKLRLLHQALQGEAGAHFSAPDRVALRKEPSAGYLLVYSQTYTMIIRDYTGMKTYPNKITDPALDVQQGTRPASGAGLFTID